MIINKNYIELISLFLFNKKITKKIVIPNFLKIKKKKKDEIEEEEEEDKKGQEEDEEYEEDEDEEENNLIQFIIEAKSNNNNQPQNFQTSNNDLEEYLQDIEDEFIGIYKDIVKCSNSRNNDNKSFKIDNGPQNISKQKNHSFVKEKHQYGNTKSQTPSIDSSNDPKKRKFDKFEPKDEEE
ncbi:hypothetical protein DICPUDRAFT_80474 [Dictyostelium purpureum]|uniref:Uncharacterized protein n=1 Tax=Dictyostelium purpureum TaxID=5786 RepID=F0ZQK8_DICPU|nr:uncharacterized protein DICPUDRAFT_80474 [Dictyostelium purpureum]EGC33770.1 hypothetical protein DICPUDRAFT_80474 [Dictyostelium purpureum]|eukprot:XP_003289695.1 hypothetical protein DICPUDRAFT_80474 [Dictyostelium purpureum]